MFDFDPDTFGVSMQVAEAPDVNRYETNSAPKWLNVKIQPPNFVATQHLNSILSIFHFNQGDCQIVPATYIMDYNRCKMDIDRNLYYLKITCSSVLEARRRALVLAYLTYDMTRHIFIKLNTGEMLENPFDHQNVYEVQELYNLEVYEDVVNVQSNISKQAQQLH
jgi:hypothetical protein